MTLHTEIFEQPHIMRDLLDRQMDNVRRIAEVIQSLAPGYIFLAARGTSDNAGRYANYLWGSMNGLPVALAAPSLFTMYSQPPSLREALVVGISQSGQSPDIISVLKEGHRQGCRCLAITNAPDSALGQAADYIIDIQAGTETAVAATKTYTAELMAIAMLAVALRKDDTLFGELNRTPDWAAQALELDASLAGSSERYRFMSHCAVIGRGYNYATAFEWSLKLKELAYIVAEPYSTADFLHGPVAMVERGFPVLAVAPAGMVYKDVLSLLRRLRGELLAELVVISDQEEALNLAQTPMPLPRGIPEWLSPLIGIIAGQMFAYHLTRARGLDPDQPRTIHKVTETR
ncbi:MAG: glucosamine--fructose-6-phosphate aminotransferase [Chloroflexi bacterium RBG_16_54_18]|nr:MAG: glucosamine--fructose-6-phosphate aminotransferase [Chloroflexi bacterium RBG_16_54_18]